MVVDLSSSCDLFGWFFSTKNRLPLICYEQALLKAGPDDVDPTPVSVSAMRFVVDNVTADDDERIQATEEEGRRNSLRPTGWRVRRLQLTSRLDTRYALMSLCFL